MNPATPRTGLGGFLVIIAVVLIVIWAVSTAFWGAGKGPDFRTPDHPKGTYPPLRHSPTSPGGLGKG